MHACTHASHTQACSGVCVRLQTWFNVSRSSTQPRNTGTSRWGGRSWGWGRGGGGNTRHTYIHQTHRRMKSGCNDFTACVRARQRVCLRTWVHRIVRTSGCGSLASCSSSLTKTSCSSRSFPTYSASLLCGITCIISVSSLLCKEHRPLQAQSGGMTGCGPDTGFPHWRL
jgi:hypothetical protein